MKNKTRLLTALLSVACMSAGAVTLTACNEENTTDARDPKIVAVYTAYADSTENPLSYDEWLAELLATAKGEKGETGPQGENGKDGEDGENGKSAYEIYLENIPAESTPLTEEEWLASLKGEQGETGPQGENGKDGKDGKDGEDGKDGKDGATWLTGNVMPDDTVAAKEGDFYLDTVSCKVYQMTGEGWIEIANLRDSHVHNYVFAATLNPVADEEETFYLLYCTECGATKIDVHVHEYGEWEVTLPTENETGLAVSTCEGNAEHKIELVLPVLTDDSYQVESTATCTVSGSKIYTYNKDGYTVTFTIPEEAKGHVYGEETEIAPTETEQGKIVKTCSECGDVQIVTMFDKKVATESNAKDTPITLDGEGKYLVECATTGPLTYYGFTVDTAGEYTVTLIDGGNTLYMTYAYYGGTTQILGGRGAVASGIDYVTIEKNGSYTVKFVFTATEEMAANNSVVSFSVKTNAQAGAKYLMNFERPEGEFSKTFSVTVTNTYLTAVVAKEEGSVYTFVAPKDGWYELIVPSETNMSVDEYVKGVEENGADDKYITMLDGDQGNKVVFEAEQNQTFVFVFYAAAQTGDFNITISETEEPVDDALYISPETPVALTMNNKGEVCTIVVANGVAEGKYLLSMSGGLLLYRAAFRVSINDSETEYWYQIGASDDAGSGQSRTLDLKAGDKIIITSETLTSISFDLTMSEVNEE